MSNENISGGGGEFGVQFSKVLDLREASVDPPTPPDWVWSSDAGRAAAVQTCSGCCRKEVVKKWLAALGRRC